jgi:hypothetical protein
MGSVKISAHSASQQVACTGRAGMHAKREKTEIRKSVCKRHEYMQGGRMHANGSNFGGAPMQHVLVAEMHARCSKEGE